MEPILEKIAELGVVIKAIQDKNTEIEKKYDGVTKEEMKKLEEVGVKLSEEVETLQAASKSAEEQKAKVENLEKIVALGGGKKGDEFKEYDGGLARYLRKGTAINTEVEGKMIESYLSLKNLGMTEEEISTSVKSLQVQSNPDGGYWIMPERLDSTVTRIFESSPMRQLANVISTANESVDMIIDDDEADAEWVAEVQSRSDTDTPKIGLLSIHAHELMAQPKATQKMLDDAGFNVESWLAGKVSDRFARKENTSFVLGDGNLKPKGFLSYAEWASPGVYQRDALERIDTGANGVISSDNLIDLQGSLIEGYQLNASFLMKRQTFFSQILTLKDDQSRYLFDPQLLKNGAGQFVILGQPVFFGADMPASGATGAESIAYGDFNKGYMIVDRMGIRVLRDPFTSKPFVKFYTTKRTGGAVTNYEALKILKEEV